MLVWRGRSADSAILDAGWPEWMLDGGIRGWMHGREILGLYGVLCVEQQD